MLRLSAYLLVAWLEAVVCNADTRLNILDSCWKIFFGFTLPPDIAGIVYLILSKKESHNDVPK